MSRAFPRRSRIATSCSNSLHRSLIAELPDNLIAASNPMIASKLEVSSFSHTGTGKNWAGLVSGVLRCSHKIADSGWRQCYFWRDEYNSLCRASGSKPTLLFVPSWMVTRWSTSIHSLYSLFFLSFCLQFLQHLWVNLFFQRLFLRHQQQLEAAEETMPTLHSGFFFRW